VAEASQSQRPFKGSLPDFPELTWEDFERGSELAQSDFNGQ